jgi:two-component system CheB/CheR fusion protein
MVHMHEGSASAAAGNVSRQERVLEASGGSRAPFAPGTGGATSLRAHAAPTRSLRILLVDDNADYVDLMAAALQCQGHSVLTLYDGLAARDSAPAFRPDVVLLDIGLPGLDGYSLARALRAHAATRNALLVAVSGYGSARDRARSRAAGIDLHLLKPITLTEITQAMAEGMAAAASAEGWRRRLESVT